MADNLTYRGHQLLSQGNASEAYQTWDQALQIYRREKNHEGVMGTLINQSQAQQDMGQNFNACWSLISALEFDAELCRSEYNPSVATRLSTRLERLDSSALALSGLQNLGIVSRAMWKLPQAQRILDYALQKAKFHGDPAITAAVELELANTNQAQWRALQERFRLTQDVEEKSKLLQESHLVALEGFQQLQSFLDRDHPMAVQAKINWLQFYQQLATWIAIDGEYPTLVQLERELRPQTKQIIKELASSDFERLSPVEKIYGRLKTAHNIQKLSQYKNVSDVVSSPTQLIQHLGQTSLEQARVLKNSRGEAQAQIILGQTYRETGQYSQAFNALNRAYNLSFSSFEPDMAYQGAWQLAQLNRQTGNREGALKAYENAIAALEQVRGDLLSVNQSLQFSFREDVEPAYRQYLQMLTTASQPDYKKILVVSSKLELVTLENYLRCGRLSFVPLQEQPNLPTTFTFINVEDRIDVLVRQNGSLHQYSANKRDIEFNIAQLLKILQDDNFEATPDIAILPYAQALYEALIEPGEQWIGPDERIIIVDNGNLNNIPPGILHNGREYLIQQYAISLSLGSVVNTPPKKRKPKVLFAGIAEQSPLAKRQGFPALPEIRQELENMVALHGNTQTSLLDETFTVKRLHEKLASNRYSILHLATHGKFSSDSTDTFLMAWNGLLGVFEFDQLLKEQTNRDSPGLDLIFLSACESAKGDRRSQLGLAGLATQAGARNAIATLWRVDSESTALLASEFYRQLAEGQTYTQALRKAQLKLMQSEDFNHPYYWAPFVLLGGI
jgi:CHAT domain-containing protein